MTKSLRPSSYVNEVDIGDGNALLFNGLSMCIDVVPADFAKAIMGRSDLSFLTDGERTHLLERGHLTFLPSEQERDEFRKTIDFISAKVAKNSRKHSGASITFMLTYNCNLACTYCFQSPLSQDLRRHSMTGAFVDDFFENCFPQLFPETPKESLFTLFGGEPLLPKNREAITRILAHSEKFPSCRINVATNGVTLARMLDLVGPEKGKIQSVQITLDGDEAFHDQHRIPSSAKPTFGIMHKAIERVIEAKADVAIRVHLHPHRLQSAEMLIQRLDLEGLLTHPQVYIYFSPLNDYSADQQSQEDVEIFRRIFQHVAKQSGRPPSHLMYMNSFLTMQGKKDLPTVRYCGLGNGSFFAVDPLGDIYECYDEAGDTSRKVAKFSNGKIEYFALKDEYARRTLNNLPECLDCSLSIFCGGGCPVRAKETQGSIFEPYCQQNKEFIRQTLKAFYLRQVAEAAEKPKRARAAKRVPEKSDDFSDGSMGQEKENNRARSDVSATLG